MGGDGQRQQFVAMAVAGWWFGAVIAVGGGGDGSW